MVLSEVVWNILVQVGVGEDTLAQVGAPGHIQNLVAHSLPGQEVLEAVAGFHPGRPASPGPIRVAGIAQYLEAFYLAKTHTRHLDCQTTAPPAVVERKPVD